MQSRSSSFTTIRSASRKINELKTMLSQAEEKSKEYRHTIVDLEGQLEQQGVNRRGQLLSTEEQLRATENALEQEGFSAETTSKSKGYLRPLERPTRR